MAERDKGDEGERPWWRGRRKREPEGAMVADTRTADPSDNRHGGHGPKVGQVSTGSGGSIVPIVFGILALVMILGFQFGAFRWIANHLGSEAPSRDDKTAAMTEAELAVAQTLRTASSIVFDSVRGVGAHEACGVVEGRNHDRSATRKRFIFQTGMVRLDDGSDAFARDWAKDCQPVGAVTAGSADTAAPRHHRRRAG